MLHVIDANNLAGKMELLDMENFDRALIDLVKNYYQEKKIEVFLVFDPIETMGDRFREGYLTVVYTPRDGFYSSADDKIIEIVKASQEKQIRVITDDLEIIAAVEKIAERPEKDIDILRASDFARKLMDKKRIEQASEELDEDEINKINKELLKIWK